MASLSLLIGGLAAAVAQLFTGFFGTVVAILLAVVLAVRGQRSAALSVLGVTALILLAFLLVTGAVGGSQVEPERLD